MKSSHLGKCKCKRAYLRLLLLNGGLRGKGLLLQRLLLGERLLLRDRLLLEWAGWGRADTCSGGVHFI
jgi:hypothetical protein